MISRQNKLNTTHQQTKTPVQFNEIHKFLPKVTLLKNILKLKGALVKEENLTL